MALTKVNYVDGVTTIMAKNLNDIQNEVIANGTAIATQATQISTKANASALTAETTAREEAVSAEATARAAADTALGDELDDVKSALNEYNANNIFVDGTYSSSTWHGVTLTWSNRVATLSGTVSGGNFTSPNIFYNTAAFPNGISAGDVLTFFVKSTNTKITLHVFFYVDGAWTSNPQYVTESRQIYVPNDATGMLMRLYVANGEDSTGTFTFDVLNSLTDKDTLSLIPFILPGAGNDPSAMRDVTNFITGRLEKYGSVFLGKGTYKISDLVMPDNTVIRGAGESTILHVPAGHDGIKVGANCTIENVTIEGEQTQSTTPHSNSGIIVEGNYEDAPYIYNTKLNNLTIRNFSLAGIKGLKTGYWSANSISANNLRIYNCYAGIRFADKCEFNRVSNSIVYNCYIGIFIASGNNVVVNCSFSNNTTGVYMDGTDATIGANNGHGSLIGCTVNHSNNNTGYAFIIKGVSNGFVINGCNIWYGKILVDAPSGGSSGVLFSNCLLGGGTPEIINWGANALILSSCIFKAAPTFSGNNPTIKTNCYMVDGTPIA